jgi:hypothetical protein
LYKKDDKKSSIKYIMELIREKIDGKRNKIKEREREREKEREIK